MNARTVRLGGELAESTPASHANPILRIVVIGVVVGQANVNFSALFHAVVGHQLEIRFRRVIGFRGNHGRSLAVRPGLHRTTGGKKDDGGKYETDQQCDQGTLQMGLLGNQTRDEQTLDAP